MKFVSAFVVLICRAQLRLDHIFTLDTLKSKYIAI